MWTCYVIAVSRNSLLTVSVTLYHSGRRHRQWCRDTLTRTIRTPHTHVWAHCYTQNNKHVIKHVVCAHVHCLSHGPISFPEWSHKLSMYGEERLLIIKELHHSHLLTFWTLSHRQQSRESVVRAGGGEMVLLVWPRLQHCCREAAHKLTALKQNLLSLHRRKLRISSQANKHLPMQRDATCKLTYRTAGLLFCMLMAWNSLCTFESHSIQFLLLQITISDEFKGPVGKI